MTSKIIHIDMDCFYAAIEIRDNPSLTELPIAVGGDPGRRGVLTTCNYKAREFGCRSAMASAHALRLCPDLEILPVDIPKYRRVSADIHSILHDYTGIIEPLSLDEAYLDVTEVELHQNSATLIAKDIRRRISDELGLTASAGVAPNKSLAKIASDWNKPNGQFVIRPQDVADFMLSLPVRKLFGVGKVTEEKMKQQHIHTCADLQKLSKLQLSDLFGSFGEKLYVLSRGVDQRPVIVNRDRKSVSVEVTFENDLKTLDECLTQIPNLMIRLQKRLISAGKADDVAKQFIKIKFSDFTQTTVESRATELDVTLFRKLMEEGWERKCASVRLLGLGVRFNEPALDRHQLRLPGV